MTPAALAVPDALRALPQWVVWRYEQRDGEGKPTKVPYQVSGKLAKSNEPRTWNSFEAVSGAWTRAPQRYAGIGFVFSEDDPFAGIDFDDCLGSDGKLKSWARDLLEPFSDTYMEISPSGRGVKVWAQARLDGKGHREPYQDGAIEIYDRGRFFAVTGRTLNGAPLEVKEHQADVSELYALISNGKRGSTTLSSAGDNSNGKPKADLRKQKTLLEGERYTFLQSVTAQFRGRGLDREEIYAALVVINASRCQPPKPDSVLQELADWAATLSPGKANDAEPEMNVRILADAITQADRFARDAGGRLYVFQGGVYCLNGKQFVLRRVKRLHQQRDLAYKWSTRRADEVVEYISVDCPELWGQPPADTLNLPNGLLDIERRTLRDHDPQFLSATQLPVRFDPAARCPKWEKFVAEVFPDDSRALAWELAAWAMLPAQSIQKAVLLIGEGSNGKSAFLRGLVGFLGRANTTALSLHKLEQDRFAVSRLMGKLANICPDLPTAHLTSTSVFKSLTGGDVLAGEFKFKDSFEFESPAKLIFSANAAPRSDDATHGFFRRWQVVPFARTFEEGAAGTMRRDELDAMLSDPVELSGVLNKALDALKNIRSRGFTESASMREAWIEFRETTDPLATWLDQNTDTVSDELVVQGSLMAAFNKHLTDHNKPIMAKTGFGLALKRARPSITLTQRTVDGRVKWVYLGIRMKNAGGDTEGTKPAEPEPPEWVT
ncbi:MAG: phage/plasmid primase, P4 family [Bryobacteraceae bacterium]